MIPKAKTSYFYESKKELNELGYRCDSFSIRKDINVVTIGCSNAIGFALPLEKRYSHLFCKKLKELTKKSVNDWNISQSGASNDYMSRILLETITDLKPDIIIAGFTSISRREYFNIDGKIIDFMWNETDYIKRLLKSLDKQTLQCYKCIKTLTNYNNDINNFYKNYKLIELLAKRYDIPFMFSHVHHHKEIKNAAWKPKEFPYPIGIGGCIDTATDGTHPGELSHEKMSKLFIQHYYRHFSSHKQLL